MDRDTFLHTLWDHLVGRMPPDEVDKVMRQYADRFDREPDHREIEISAELGDPVALANQVVNEWAAQAPPTFSPRNGQSQSGSWIKILLGIFIGIPVAFAGVCTVGGVLIGTFACLMVLAGLVVGGFSVLFSAGLMTAIYYIGGGLLAGGIGLLIAAMAMAFCRLCFQFLAFCFRGGNVA